MLHVTDGNTHRVMSCLEAGPSGPASGLWYPHTGTTTHQKPHMHGGDLVQGHPAAAWGLFPLQEPPKRRALASGDLQSYALGQLVPMHKT